MARYFSLSQTKAHWTAVLACMSLLVLVAATPARAQVGGISYSIAPVGTRVFWADDAVLEDGFLYGGAFGLNFGRYVQLSGVYLLNNNLRTDSSAYMPFAQAGFSERDVDVRRYGGRLRINLGGGFGETAEVLPYVSVGTGIIEFDPENVAESEYIYATAGAGLTFSVGDRYTLSLGGQVLAYEYNPVMTFLTPAERGAFANPGQYDEIVYNPAVRAALRIYLGGRDLDELTAVDRALLGQFGDGAWNLIVEPMYGRIDFAEELGFPKDQNIAGLAAGIELGPYLGLRGFYWRGVEGNEFFDGIPEEFQDIAFYGGELNLHFTSGLSGLGVTPYLILGGGYMNVLSGYQDDYEGTQPPPDDRYFATGGVGVEVGLGSNLTVLGGLRYLLMSNMEAENVNQPSAIQASPLYTFGLSFSLGGDEPTAGEVLEERAERRAAADREERRALEEQLRGEAAEREAARRAEIQRLQARLDSLAQVLQERRMQEQMMQEQMMQERQMQQQAATPLAEEVEQLEQAVENLEEAPMDGREAPANNLSNESITIPVPQVGEIYIRIGETGTTEDVDVETVYGPPVVIPPTGRAAAPPVRQAPPARQAPADQLTAREIQQIVRETLRAEMEQAQAAGDALTAEEIRDIVREALAGTDVAAGDASLGRLQMEEIEQRLSEIEENLEDQIDELARRVALQEQREDEEPPRVRIIEEDGGEGDGDGDVRVVGGSYAPSSFVPVAGFTAAGGSFVFGVRGDYNDNLSFGGYSVRFVPEVTLGVGDNFTLAAIANGVVDFNAAGQYVGLNQLTPYVGAGIGLASDLGLGINLLTGVGYDFGGGSVFIEYSTFDFFDYGRFLIGYRTGL